MHGKKSQFWVGKKITGKKVTKNIFFFFFYFIYYTFLCYKWTLLFLLLLISLTIFLFGLMPCVLIINFQSCQDEAYAS